MPEEPLRTALEQIAPKLDETLQPLVAALIADRSVEETWEGLLKEILDEA